MGSIASIFADDKNIGIRFFVACHIIKFIIRAHNISATLLAFLGVVLKE
jgi:hypothetical protein